MTCGACVRHVDVALRALPFVRDVEVQLARGAVRVTHEPGAPIEALREAVRQAGYEVV